MRYSLGVRLEGVRKASNKQGWIGCVPVDIPNALFLNDSQKRYRLILVCYNIRTHIRIMFTTACARAHGLSCKVCVPSNTRVNFEVT
jgi:hypothetical protein